MKQIDVHLLKHSLPTAVQQAGELPDMKDLAVLILIVTFQPNYHPFRITDYVQSNIYDIKHIIVITK